MGKGVPWNTAKLPDAWCHSNIETLSSHCGMQCERPCWPVLVHMALLAVGGKLLPGKEHAWLLIFAPLAAADPAATNAEFPPAELVPAPTAAPSTPLVSLQDPASGIPSQPDAELELLVAAHQKSALEFKKQVWYFLPFEISAFWIFWLFYFP